MTSRKFNAKLPIYYAALINLLRYEVRTSIYLLQYSKESNFMILCYKRTIYEKRPRNQISPTYTQFSLNPGTINRPPMKLL